MTQNSYHDIISQIAQGAQLFITERAVIDMAQKERHVFEVTDRVARVTKTLGIIPSMYKRAQAGDRQNQFALICQFYGGRQNLPSDRDWLDWNDFSFHDTGEIAQPVKNAGRPRKEVEKMVTTYERPYCCCDYLIFDQGCTMCDLGDHESCSRV